MRFVTRAARLSAVAAILLLTSIALTGCDAADSGPDYSRAYITQFSLQQLSFTDANGQSWDPFGGQPDPVFVLYDANNVALAQSSTFQDVTPQNLPLRWTLAPNYEITDFNKSYYIAMWDADVDEYDLMATTGMFTMRELAERDFSTTMNFTGAGVQADMTVRWAE